MGNKPVKEEKEEKEEKKDRDILLLKVVPPLDRTYTRWLARELERKYRFMPKNPRALEPPDHVIEYMKMNGMLDIDLDDPDLTHLLK